MLVDDRNLVPPPPPCGSSNAGISQAREKFPSPPRNNDYPWTNETLLPKGLRLITEERFKNSVNFSKQQLTLYFTTQSNIIAAVENNYSTYEQAETWLNQELAVFYETEEVTRVISYGNWIKYIQQAK